MKSLRVATCQFSVEADIAHNLRYVVKQIHEAADQKAKVAHFSECALSGYAGVEFDSIADLDWDELKEATRQIQSVAKQRKIWVLLGSTHQLTKPNKPHNCVYVIRPNGQIVDRYDKRYCTGECKRKPTMDLSHYSPGNRFVTFRVSSVTCGILICYDYRFPELYREYKRQGTDVIFQSFHNARSTVVDDQEYNIWKTIVPATMSCRAAENYFWVSANNSTTKPSRWGSFTVRPDGAIVGKLPLHRPGVLITDFKIGPDYFDAAGPWRESTMSGQLHSGVTVDDPRSTDVECL